jgi:hypothetical protein
MSSTLPSGTIPLQVPDNRQQMPGRLPYISVAVGRPHSSTNSSGNVLHQASQVGAPQAQVPWHLIANNFCPLVSGHLRFVAIILHIQNALMGGLGFFTKNYQGTMNYQGKI